MCENKINWFSEFNTYNLRNYENIKPIGANYTPEICLSNHIFFLKYFHTSAIKYYFVLYMSINKKVSE